MEKRIFPKRIDLMMMTLDSLRLGGHVLNLAVVGKNDSSNLKNTLFCKVCILYAKKKCICVKQKKNI